MRAKNVFLVLTALIVLGLASSSALAAGQVTYLGKTTWTATITDSTKGADIGVSFTVTGGISRVGDEFYLFQGYVTMESDGPFVMSGSGFLMGDTLEFTLAESQQHTGSTWRDSGVMHVTIDKTTLNGTMYDIGHDFNPEAGQRTFDERYTAANLTLSGPPIPLTQSLAYLQLLLGD